MWIILIEPSVVMFKKSTQTYNTADPLYTIPVVRTRNQESPATVYCRTNKASRFDISSPLKFAPGETEKNFVIDPRAYPSPIIPETFQLELFDPSNNAIVGERKTTLVNVIDGRGENTGGLESGLGSMFATICKCKFLTLVHVYGRTEHFSNLQMLNAT